MGGEMARKLGVAAATVALLALVISMIMPAAADKRYDRRVLHLAVGADVGGETFIDVGDEGEGVGDYVIINHPMFNRALTKEVGTVRADCLLVEETKCEVDATFDLRGGLITVEGPLDFTAETDEFAVTGGTGAYKTAHGVLVVTTTEKREDFVFKLLL
jgi:hypothetical protein